MEHKPESAPFLGYTDIPVSAGESGSITTLLQTHNAASSAAKQAAARRSRLARDFAVFFAASLLWLGVMFFAVVPSTTTAKTSSTAAAIINNNNNNHVNYHLHNVTSNARFVACGNSTADARAAGCRYDPLLNHWVPGACVDQEWIDEYQDDGSWTAFADVNLTQPLSPEDMGERDQYYTSIRDHVNHCAMLWRKQFWTLFEERDVFDGVIVNTYHTEHCASFLAGLYGLERTEPTLVKVGFSGCWVKDEQEL